MSRLAAYHVDIREDVVCLLTRDDVHAVSGVNWYHVYWSTMYATFVYSLLNIYNASCIGVKYLLKGATVVHI